MYLSDRATSARVSKGQTLQVWLSGETPAIKPLGSLFREGTGGRRGRGKEEREREKGRRHCRRTAWSARDTDKLSRTKTTFPVSLSSSISNHMTKHPILHLSGILISSMLCCRIALKQQFKYTKIASIKVIMEGRCLCPTQLAYSKLKPGPSHSVNCYRDNPHSASLPSLPSFYSLLCLYAILAETVSSPSMRCCAGHFTPGCWDARF